MLGEFFDNTSRRTPATDRQPGYLQLVHVPYGGCILRTDLGVPKMERTASGSETFPASVFEGWNIGAVSVKRVRLHEEGAMETDIRRHGGDPNKRHPELPGAS